MFLLAKWSRSWRAALWSAMFASMAIRVNLMLWPWSAPSLPPWKKLPTSLESRTWDLRLSARTRTSLALYWERSCSFIITLNCNFSQVVNHAKSSRLEKFEIPGAVTLTQVEWTPVRISRLLGKSNLINFQDTGLTTAAMKLKRKPLQEFYKDDLDRMYGN